MYYVYELIDHRDNTVFYVGKGSSNRKDVHVQKVRLGMVSENRYKDKVIRDIYNETGVYPESRIVKYFEDENHAYSYEESLIEQYGTYKNGGMLTNIMLNNRPPDHTGRKRSKVTKQKLSNRCGEKNPMWGRKQSKETKEMWKEVRSGEKMARSKTWEVISPDGTTYTVTNVYKWAKEKDINPQWLYKQQRGWKCQSIT